MAAIAVGALALLCLCVGVVWVLPKVREGNLAGGSLISVGTRTPTQSVVKAPTRAAFTPGQVVLADSFVDNKTGWSVGTVEGAGIQRAVADGAYHIEILSEDMVAWSTAGDAYQVDDFVLEVDATPLAGPDDNGYGVVFRYVDRENFYYFEISSDGYYQLRSNYEDEWVHLIDWVETDAINLGKQRNHITVVARGNQFEFQINGQTVATFEDDSFASGSFGMAVSTRDEGGVHVAFDNLEVRRLR